MTLTDFPPIHDVVLVMEDTAAAGPFIRELKHNYILPTLEHFNGGPLSNDVPWAALKCASSYSLVLFRASDCIPRWAKTTQEMTVVNI